MDYLTKWPEARAVADATAESASQFIYEQIICQHGCPQIILSDHETHFNNNMIKNLMEKFKINHLLSTPYHPQTNGLVERFNRTLCESLAKVSEKENQWDEHIKSVLFGYRTTKQRTTKHTPFYLTYGREATLPIDMTFEEKHEEMDTKEITEKEVKEMILHRTYELINLVEGRKIALENIEKSQNQQKERYDAKITKETEFKIGDEVLLKESYKEKQYTGKLSDNWKGPYYIYEVIGKGAYRLKTLDGKILKGTQNVKNLKGYNNPRRLEIQIHV